MKAQIVELFKRHNADIVSFGNIERFKEASLIKNLMPECKTVIGAVFRQLRGSKRGIEEGTTYYQYSTNSVEVLEENVMPRALLAVCSFIEKHGYDALPQRCHPTVSAKPGNSDFEVDYRESYTGCSTELQLNFAQCAVDCGLGELGMSGSLLTDDFGPFARCVFILTAAELAPDPVVLPHLCDRCGECIRGCPGKALGKDGKRNFWQCAAYYIGANMTKNPFMPPEAFAGNPDRAAILSGHKKLTEEEAKEVIEQMIYYPPLKHAYWASICGRACDTACYIHLEEKGVLSKKFHAPFRKRPEWHLDILAPAMLGDKS